MIVKATDEYLALLNQAVAREIQVSAQYMLQHTKMEKLKRKVIKENYLLESTTYDEFGTLLKELAIIEMKHLAQIMERIYILGGEATTKPDRVVIGNSMKEFADMILDWVEENAAWLEAQWEKVSDAVRPGIVIANHAWEPYQFRRHRSHEVVVPSPLNPLLLAGGYTHLQPSFTMGASGTCDRDTRIEIERAESA